jgi:hypothetical protein
MKRAGEVLSTIFDERLMKKAQGYSRLFDFWAEAARQNGIAAAADHSRIRELDRGILLVEADHPGWIQILQTKERQILAAFHRAFPDQDIFGISLMLSRGGAREPAGDGTGEAQAEQAADESVKAAAESPAVTGPDDQTKNAGYDGIKDDVFKETLKRLEKSIAIREKKK